MLDLSIVLITYNRASLLQKTLESLLESPLAKCELIILNNHSIDNTIEVAENFKAKFENFKLITHRFNIGGNANILRAYEYGTRFYKWILCDDDKLDFSDVDDLLSVLEEKEISLIRVAECGIVKTERGTDRTLESLLHDPDSLTFYSLGFVPGIIFRSDRVGSNIQYGYKNIYTCYSQLFVLLKSFSIEERVYTTRQIIVHRGHGVMSIGSEIIIYQLQSLDALPTKKAKKMAMHRRRGQNPLRWIFGYAELLLADFRLNRTRAQMLQIWWKTVMIAPSLLGKFIFFINVFPVFLPMRQIAKLLGKKLSSNMEEVEKRGVF